MRQIPPFIRFLALLSAAVIIALIINFSFAANVEDLDMDEREQLTILCAGMLANESNRGMLPDTLVMRASILAARINTEIKERDRERNLTSLSRAEAARNTDPVNVGTLPGTENNPDGGTIMHTSLETSDNEPNWP